jgi:hypothetical protein
MMEMWKWGVALVLAKRPRGSAAVHVAEKIAHVERLLLRLGHDFRSPVGIEARHFIISLWERRPQVECSILNMQW